MVTRLLYKKVIFYFRREPKLGRNLTVVITAIRHLSIKVFFNSLQKCILMRMFTDAVTVTRLLYNKVIF